MLLEKGREIVSLGRLDCRFQKVALGVPWLSGRVLDLRPRGHGFEPHRHPGLGSFSKTPLS